MNKTVLASLALLLALTPACRRELDASEHGTGEATSQEGATEAPAEVLPPPPARNWPEHRPVSRPGAEEPKVEDPPAEADAE